MIQNILKRTKAYRTKGCMQIISELRKKIFDSSHHTDTACSTKVVGEKKKLLGSLIH